MSKATPRGLEEAQEGNNPNGPRDHPQSTRPSQEESNFGDSSGPLFSIYSKAAEEEDSKMVERWQKDADGILFFTGLFSAAVATLLSVTVQDLRPNSQDTSAFYLGNIYEVLADPNVTRASVPSPDAKPPPFSPPRYAIWVNSLWFLSLVMSLSCALWATSLHQWARRYIRLTQPARRLPEERALMRAFFAGGIDKMHIPLAVEGLPTLLHLSLFLFFGGLVIFLFNVDQEVFTCVIWWIGLFSILYGLITVLPLIRKDSPYYTPLSKPAWYLYTSITYVTFEILTSIAYVAFVFLISITCLETWERCRDLRDRYYSRMLGGVEKKAKDTALKRASEIYARILGWTASALGDDDSLERFFEAIPGFFNSKLVSDLHLPGDISGRLWDALGAFIVRTLSSNSVTEPVKSRRVIICKDIIPCFDGFHILYRHLNRAPVSIEKVQIMAQWLAHAPDVSVRNRARTRAAADLARVQDRDGRWIALARDLYGLSERELQDNVAHGGDNVLLAILIHLSRHVGPGELTILEALSQFDIHHTLPELQDDFCALWNELVHKASSRRDYGFSLRLLKQMRHLYFALHQGTDAPQTAVSASTKDRDPILSRPSSYPLCDIAGHLQNTFTMIHATPMPSAVAQLTQPGYSSDVSPHQPALGCPTALRPAETITGLPSPDPSITSEIGETFRTSTATFPVRSSSPFSDKSQQDGVVTAEPDSASVAKSSYPRESDEQQGQATPYVAPPGLEDISGTVPTAAPVPVSTPPFATHDASPPFTSKFSLPAPSDNISAPGSYPLSHTPFLPNAELLPPLSGVSPKSPSENAMLPHLQTCSLVDNGNMCLANAVLQLLVYGPPFRDLLRDSGWLVGHHEGGKTGGDATPLMDAMVSFLEKFAYKENSSLLCATRGKGKARENEGEKEDDDRVDPLIPTEVYDAVKGKRQFIDVRGGLDWDATEFLRFYLRTLDEELVALQTSISTHKPTSTLELEELEEENRSGEGQTEVGASSAESPISRIFGSSRSAIGASNQPDTITVPDWRLLELDIHPDSVHTVEDALSHISQPRSLQIETLPPVLVLHLKRFLHDGAANGIVKIRKPVQFAPKLKIPLEIMTPVAGESSGPAQYKLFGVLYHHGEPTGNGHYTVDVFHPNGAGGSGEGWLHIDDETVNAVQHEDVFGEHGIGRVDNRCAYMLFYCLIVSAARI